MKTVFFDKLVALTIDRENNSISINWLSLLIEDLKVFEKQNLTIAEAEAIVDWYEKNAEWNYSREDSEKIQMAVAEKERENKKEINLFIDGKPISEIIKQVEAL